MLGPARPAFEGSGPCRATCRPARLLGSLPGHSGRSRRANRLPSRWPPPHVHLPSSRSAASHHRRSSTAPRSSCKRCKVQAGVWAESGQAGWLRNTGAESWSFGAHLVLPGRLPAKKRVVHPVLGAAGPGNEQWQVGGPWPGKGERAVGCLQVTRKARTAVRWSGKAALGLLTAGATFLAAPAQQPLCDDPGSPQLLPGLKRCFQHVAKAWGVPESAASPLLPACYSAQPSRRGLSQTHPQGAHNNPSGSQSHCPRFGLLKCWGRAGGSCL